MLSSNISSIKSDVVKLVLSKKVIWKKIYKQWITIDKDVHRSDHLSWGWGMLIFSLKKNSPERRQKKIIIRSCHCQGGIWVKIEEK